MAFVINPDGTITTVDVDWDPNGNLRPKKDYGEFKSSYTFLSSTSNKKVKTEKQKKRNKKDVISPISTKSNSDTKEKVLSSNNNNLNKNNKKNKKNKNKNKNKKEKGSIHRSEHNSLKNTIGDIATFSYLKDSLSNSDIFYRNSNVSRHPAFGYARDKFGRVQERDSFNEEIDNEFKQAQQHQTGYDYSNYDAEDDHDSYYDSEAYE